MTSYIRRLSSFIFDVLQSVVLALAIFMLIYLFAVQPHQVDGHSMFPSFKSGEYLLTDKISYQFGNPKRGDVIIFEAPPTRSQDFIKRIVGLPGDTIMIQGGKVSIDNKTLEETYLAPDTTTHPGAFLAEGRVYTLNADEYIVLGDNRDNSLDSRRWGPIKKDDIVGRAWVVYWPPQSTGLIPGVTYAGF